MVQTEKMVYLKVINISFILSGKKDDGLSRGILWLNPDAGNQEILGFHTHRYKAEWVIPEQSSNGGKIQI